MRGHKVLLNMRVWGHKLLGKCLRGNMVRSTACDVVVYLYSAEGEQVADMSLRSGRTGGIA